MNSNWTGAAVLPCVTKEFEKSPKWTEYEELLIAYAAQTGGPKKTGGRAASPPATDEKEILRKAMGVHSLNGPKLASKVRAELKVMGRRELKVDRSTTYRIITGKTTKPDPAIRNAIIKVLELDEREAALVQHWLGGAKPKRAPQKKF